MLIPYRFLWASLVLDNVLNCCRTPNQVRKAIQELPTDLEKLYMALLDSRRGSEHLCDPRAIMFVCAAPKPMQEDAVRQLLAMDLTTGNYSSSDMMSTDAVIQAGVGLITLDKTEKLVLPAHDTVRTFIFSNAAHAAVDLLLRSRFDLPGNFLLSVAMSQESQRERRTRLLLGRACLVHIRRRTSRSLATLPSRTQRTLPTMTASIPSPLQGLIRMMLPHAQGKATVSVQLPSQGNAAPAQHDGFFRYARGNWLACNYDLDDDEVWQTGRDRKGQRSLFRIVATQRIESWDMHPWPALTRSASQHLAGMFAYSVANCHLPLLRLALQHKDALPKNIFTGLLPDHDHLPALHVACKLGFNVLLPTLSEVCDLFATDSRLRTALHYAAESGHIACVQALRPELTVARRALAKQMDDQSDTALHLALLNGYDNIILCLRNDYGADMSLRDANLSLTVDEALRRGLISFIQKLVDEGQLVEDELTADQAAMLSMGAIAERHRQLIMAVRRRETQIVRA